MKVIKYTMMIKVNHGTEEEPNFVQTFHACEIQCSDDMFEANYAIAQREAYGEITVDDIEEPVIEPSQLDRVEAQVTYTALMTDTLLEEV